MRLVSDDLDAEVAGTSAGDRWEAVAFRGGDLVAGPLTVLSFSAGWDAEREVQGQATLVVDDPDGTLAPWGMGDALAPGGSRIQLTWVSGTSSIRVPFGLWRIRKSAPSERWVRYGGKTATAQVAGSATTITVDGDIVTVDSDEGTFTIPDAYVTTDAEAGTFTILDGYATPSGFTEVTTSTPVSLIHGGGTITLDIDEDVTATALMERIDGDSPTVNGSTIAEIRRLLRAFGAVDASDAPDDATIPTSYSDFPESRTDAIGDLLDMMKARARVGGDGSLQLVPRAGAGPVWTLEGGDGGVLIGIQRAMSDDGVFNAVTSKSTTTDGSPLVGRARVDGGPLMFGGPFGRVPVGHEATSRTQAGVTADAAETLADIIEAGMVDLAVECMFHPGIQMHDVVTLVAPTVVGGQELNGRVVGLSVGSSGSTPSKRMSLTVRVSTEVLEVIAGRVRRG